MLLKSIIAPERFSPVTTVVSGMSTMRIGSTRL
jgi:hypothetical protein